MQFSSCATGPLNLFAVNSTDLLNKQKYTTHSNEWDSNLQPQNYSDVAVNLYHSTICLTLDREAKTSYIYNESIYSTLPSIHCNARASAASNISNLMYILFLQIQMCCVFWRWGPIFFFH